MKFQNIINYINNLAEGGSYTPSEIIPKLDEMVDQINMAMNTQYKVFSELVGLNANTEYDFFPDVYIRNIICYGALAGILMQEDELEGKYKTLFYHAKDWIGYMVRDYSQHVADQYKNPLQGGYISIKEPEPDQTVNTNPMWEE